MLRNFPIAARLGAGFAAIGLIVVILGSLALNSMGNIRDRGQEVDSYWLPNLQMIGGLSQSFMRVRISTLRIVLAETESDINRFDNTTSELMGQMQQNEQRYEALLNSPAERQLLERFKQAKTSYINAQRGLVEHIRAGRTGAAMELVNDVLYPQADAVTQALIALEDYVIAGAGAAANASQAEYNAAVRLVIIAIVLAALLTVILAWVLTLSIVRPIRQAVAASEVIASGDLTETIAASGKDEPARLLASLAAMQQQLRDTIAGIANSSTQLASAAEELNAVTEDATRGLQRQDDEVQQAATAVNEMTVAVEEVANNASTTSDASQEATRITNEGRQQVDQTVQGIDKLSSNIKSSSEEVQLLAERVQSISKVLEVIGAIAEQTNLLALNAAIEAARAGEAGRGFAVVADEVRALAHRTQESTSEIEGMVSQIQQVTERAVEAMGISRTMSGRTQEMAGSAGEALQRISDAIAQINERNLVIASAAEEQAQVAREVDQNLVNIRDLSTQSAAGAEQTSSSSRELSRLAVELNDLVSRFRL
ncbi:MAG: methyl-accepting chemotaxis protein [Gammaproteobacteria bacterium]|nr:methyl-accepting chemotaxis protein [Gammaproteobacteria bacterium]